MSKYRAARRAASGLDPIRSGSARWAFACIFAVVLSIAALGGVFNLDGPLFRTGAPLHSLVCNEGCGSGGGGGIPSPPDIDPGDPDDPPYGWRSDGKQCADPTCQSVIYPFSTTSWRTTSPSFDVIDPDYRSRTEGLVKEDQPL